MASRVAFSTWESVFSLTGEIQKRKRPSQQNVGWLAACADGGIATFSVEPHC